MIRKKLNIIEREPEARDILIRDCEGVCIIPPVCSRALGAIEFQSLFLPSVCKTVSIPNDTIFIDMTEIIGCNSEIIIDNFIIPNCERPCVSSIRQSNFTIFEDIYGDTDSIVLDPLGCCSMSKAVWEAVFSSIPITSENDPNWLRLCFVEDDSLPSFIPVTPLNIYNVFLRGLIISFEYGEKEAAIAPLRSNNCFTYVEFQRIRWIFPDQNALICEEFRREKIDTIMGASLCICIGREREEGEPVDPFNLKEDYEVLTGLTIGSELWEVQRDLDDLTKMIIARSI